MINVYNNLGCYFTKSCYEMCQNIEKLTCISHPQVSRNSKSTIERLPISTYFFLNNSNAPIHAINRGTYLFYIQIPEFKTIKRFQKENDPWRNHKSYVCGCTKASGFRKF